MPETFLMLIVYIAICGAIVWGILTLVPMSEPFRKAIYVVSVLALAYYVLLFFHLLPPFLRR